jgi:ABC-type transport system involved in cytochrome c biogenesis permease subunit
MKNPVWIMRLLPAAMSLALVMVAVPCAGNEATVKGTVNTAALAEMIILDQGRLKPIDTYARKMLVQFSGRQRYHGVAATGWLARVVFTPFGAADDKVFLINNPEVADAIGIAPEKGRRYSFNELKKGYHRLASMAQTVSEKEARDRPLFDSEILRVSNNLQEYLQLSSVLMFLSPYPEFTVADDSLRAFLNLGRADRQCSYYDLVSRSKLLETAMSSLAQRDSSSWTRFDLSVIMLTKAMSQWTQSRGDQPFHIIPSTVNGKEEWLCPWVVMLDAGSTAQDLPELSSLAAMRRAFVENDGKAFTNAAMSFNAAVRRKAPVASCSVELLYNAVDPFGRSKIIFGVAVILSLLLSAVTSRRWLYYVAIAVLSAGFCLQTFGIVSRFIITHRPPVTNMYETFVFVSWAGIVLGLILEVFNKKSLGLLIASISGFFFLHLAGKYSLDEDTMGMLAAVLNSNFWLTTHIISVTLGYAGCCCAGIIGHVYCIKKIFLKTPEEKLVQTSDALYGILSFGLIFTVIGTMLGGMWADQAWGRFWGWDPKENGALLIILWCAVVFHARSSGMIRQTGTAVGAIIGLILVMFAWIGVNLLGIGMHSYGFTTRGVTMLYSFMIFEAVFFAALVVAAAVSVKRKTSA